METPQKARAGDPARPILSANAAARNRSSIQVSAARAQGRASSFPAAARRKRDGTAIFRTGK
jgi:hypothetical protein